MTKIVYLVSSLGMHNKIDGIKYAKKMDNNNHIIDNLKNDIKNSVNAVIIPGNSYDVERNDVLTQIFVESFNMSGININHVDLIDDRFNKNIKSIIESADLILLGGGYPLEQIEFFNKIDLKNILKTYNGIIIGQSAGAMNCASRVLCSPEGIENFNDPVEWEGLGLTDINIEPHFIKEDLLFNEEDKKIREKLLELSYKGNLIAIPDGSYVRIDEEGKYVVYGEYFIIKRGKIIKNKDNKKYMVI